LKSIGGWEISSWEEEGGNFKYLDGISKFDGNLVSEFTIHIACTGKAFAKSRNV